MRLKKIMLLSLVLGTAFIVSCGKGDEDKKTSVDLSKGEISFEFEEKKEKLEIEIDDVKDASFKVYEENSSEKIQLNSGVLESNDEEIEIDLSQKKPGKYVYEVVIENEDKNKVTSATTIELKEKDKDKKEDVEDKDSKAWSGKGQEYKIGDEVTHEGKEYECIQGHKSQDDWYPLNAPSLWKED